jgi:hypothetical protein
MQALQEELEKVKQQLEKEKAKNARPFKIHFKVSPKGGISVFGLQAFPVTLYKNQWLSLLDCQEDLKTFIEEHEDELQVKPGKGSKREEECIEEVKEKKPKKVVKKKVESDEE